jgi:hypothetical protein
VASDRVLDVVIRRHIFDSPRLFQAVLDGIFGGISRPDIGALFGSLAPYHDAAASQVAGRLDAEVLGLLRQVTGMPASVTT